MDIGSLDIKDIGSLDKLTLEHCNSVANLCYGFGEALGLKQEQINKLQLIGFLHDIGKLDVPNNILNKSGSLTDVEWEEMKKHPENGLNRVLKYEWLSEEVFEAVLCHHIRPDGNGYPFILNDCEIPFFAKVLTIVGAYDAMVSDRSYRKAMSKGDAIAELKGNVNTQFDFELVEIFINEVLNDSN